MKIKDFYALQKLQLTGLDEFYQDGSEPFGSREAGDDISKNIELVNSQWSVYKNCEICYFKILERYNLMTDVYMIWRTNFS